MHWNQQAEQQTEGQAGERQLIWQELGFCVSEDETEKEKSEHAEFQGGQGEPRIGVATEKKNGVEQLNEQVARRNSGLAVAALATKEQPTDDRQVVVESDQA